MDDGFPLEFLFSGGATIHTLRFLLMAGLLLAAPIASASAQETGTSSAILQVDGLSCPFCIYGLEKQLNHVDGVKGAVINMKGGKAIVRLKPGVQVDDAVLKEAVKKAGFTARAITHQ